MLLRRNLLVSYRIERALRHIGATRAQSATEHHPQPMRPLRSTHRHLIMPPSSPSTHGEWATATIGHGQGSSLELLGAAIPELPGFALFAGHCLCGFEANGRCEQSMGLAPYGKPRFADGAWCSGRGARRRITEVDQSVVGGWGRDPNRLSKLGALFEGPPRHPDDPLTQREADLARSVQESSSRWCWRWRPTPTSSRRRTNCAPPAALPSTAWPTSAAT